MTTTTSPSNTSFTCTKTRDPRLHDDQYWFPPTPNNWGAETDPNSDINEYVSFVPTTSPILSLIHNRRMVFKSSPDIWSTNTAEESADESLELLRVLIWCDARGEELLIFW
jgi:hypothetical protein